MAADVYFCGGYFGGWDGLGVRVGRCAYNRLMLRAAALTLLVGSVLAGTVAAQRTGAMSNGGAAGPTVRPGFAGPGRSGGESFHRGAFSRHHVRHEHSGAALFPYFLPYWFPDDGSYEQQPYPETVVNQPAVVQPPAAPPPPIEPKVIEVPAAAGATPAKPLPPTVFILTSGERLETRRYLLRASDLSVTVNRRQRTIPLDLLDLDATLAANHSRGIDLEIPADPNEISLRF